MADADGLLCWECVSDEVLRSWIRENGHAGKCVFCGKRRVAIALSDVAEKIDGVIREFYRPSEESAHFVPDSDNPQYRADGDSAAEIIQEIAGVELEIAEAIDDLLSASESRDVRAERSSARRCAALPRERPWVEIRACRENSYRYRLAEAKSQAFDSCESG